MSRTVRVVGLLDPPSPRSFGAVPFIEQCETGAVVHGFGPSPGPTLSPEQLAQTLADGSARPADVSIETAEGALMAGFLGLEFIATYRGLGVPPPMTTRTAHRVDDLGWIWLDDPARLQFANGLWVQEAAQVAFRHRSLEVAQLMMWADPGHLFTGAALWYAMPPRLASQEVTFQARFRQGAGEDIDEAELRRRFEVIRDGFLRPP